MSGRAPSSTSRTPCIARRDHARASCDTFRNSRRFTQWRTEGVTLLLPESGTCSIRSMAGRRTFLGVTKAIACQMRIERPLRLSHLQCHDTGCTSDLIHHDVEVRCRRQIQSQTKSVHLRDDGRPICAKGDLMNLYRHENTSPLTMRASVVVRTTILQATGHRPKQHRHSQLMGLQTHHSLQHM